MQNSVVKKKPCNSDFLTISNVYIMKYQNKTKIYGMYTNLD